MEQKPFRFEFKYVIDPLTARLVELDVLRFGMTKDPEVPAGQEEYVVSSLYFDSLLLGDYYDKAGGFPHRKKIRARMYDTIFSKATPHVWFEIKEKHDMAIGKKRLKLTNEQWCRISGGELIDPAKEGWSDTHRSVWNEIRWYTALEGRKPMVFVRYVRKPYVTRFLSDIRVTFDSNIEACKSDNLLYADGMVPIAERSVILEVKYSKALPYWWGEIVRKHNLSRTSFSKYAEGINAAYRYHALPR
ncbi:MAG: polyphosphate polymerase domain-containing protein [bacterium]|nr:polyphosphate polymerase domain-containing protein [bacterium]